MEGMKLKEVMKLEKCNVLIGLSASKGIFDKDVLESMNN